MLTAVIKTIVTIILLLALSHFSAASAQVSPSPPDDNQVSARTGQTAPQASRTITTSRPRINPTKIVAFHLRDGKLIFGKLLAEDKNKVTVERLEESRIVVSTYSKREIDPRTLDTKNVPEYKYYLDLAEYFSARTWDFRDDPDDFIQAIRCYEKAKQSVADSYGQDSERIAQIEQSLKRIKADKDVWISQVQSRAKLKKLEFEAEVENRLKELEDKVNALNQQIGESIQRLDKVVADMKSSYQKLEQNIAGIDQNIIRQLSILDDRIEATRRLIDPWSRTRYPGFYYYRPYNRPFVQP